LRKESKEYGLSLLEKDIVPPVYFLAHRTFSFLTSIYTNFITIAENIKASLIVRNQATRKCLSSWFSVICRSVFNNMEQSFFIKRRG
jgi:hypothetical protein